MPIMLKRTDDSVTSFRNAEYIPFYYFIPKSILSRCGAELNATLTQPFDVTRGLLTIPLDDDGQTMLPAQAV